MLFIFDMDGTVLNSMPQLTEEAVKVMQKYFHVTEEEARRDYLMTTGKPFVEQLKQLFNENDVLGGEERRRDAVAEYELRHYELCPTFPLAPGLQEALDTLHAKSHYAALVTSTDYHMLENLPQLKSLKFDYISGTTPKQPKILQIMRVKSWWPESPVVYLGDSCADAHYAEVAKIPFHQVTCSTVASVVTELLKKAEEQKHFQKVAR